jgi:esterase/lipase superfamily enzyme
MSDKQVIAGAALRLGAAKNFPNQSFVFVHGYNVTFENALRRAAQIAYDMHFDGDVFIFSWPSRGVLRQYFSDRETVETSAEHLRDFLEKIVAETKPAKINIIAHSVGNMMLLRALDGISETSTLRSVIGEIIHAAPDVDQLMFEQKVKKLEDMGAKITLYASRSDWALWFSSWLWSRPRAGFFENRPLVVAGVDTIDITRAGTNLFAWNHDIYAASPIIVSDMERILKNGKRPPNERTVEFEPSEDGTYWRLRSPQVADH